MKIASNARALATTWMLLIKVMAALLLLLGARDAAAQVDPWEFEVYPYKTLGHGMAELETDNAVVANGHSQPGLGTAPGPSKSQDYWFNQYELTYGLTDRIEAAAYLNLGLGSGTSLQYAGSKYRMRGRLFDEGTLPVNLGWYLELEWHQPEFDAAHLELELRPILEKDFGRFSFVANPKFEKPLTGPEKYKGFEFGYACGAYYRWMRWFSPGVEFYGGIGHIDDSEPIAEQQHYIFPVVWGELPHGIEYSVGPGIGLTPGSDHVLIKVNLALERFVGAIFGPSAENGWFF